MIILNHSLFYRRTSIALFRCHHCRRGTFFPFYYLTFRNLVNERGKTIILSLKPFLFSEHLFFGPTNSIERIYQSLHRENTLHCERCNLLSISNFLKKQRVNSPQRFRTLRFKETRLHGLLSQDRESKSLFVDCISYRILRENNCLKIVDALLLFNGLHLQQLRFSSVLSFINLQNYILKNIN